MSKTMKTLLGTVLCLCLMLGVMLCMGVSAWAEEVPEVYYGTADNLSSSGTLAEAVAAAEADSSITYIKLNKDITLAESISFNSGTYTVDLNGYTITLITLNSIGRILVVGSSVDVTFTDSSTAKTGAINGTGYSLFQISNGSLTLAGGSYRSDVGATQLVYIDGGTVSVRDSASFSSNNTSYGSIMVMGGELIIEGGSFSGSMADVSVFSKATIKGGTFASTWANIYYCGGTLDLSAMGSQANGLRLKANNTYTTEKITLPANMVIVNGSGQSVTTVDGSADGFTVSTAVKISFNANGGTGTMDAVNAPGSYPLPKCGFTAPAGKAFVGWSDSTDGEVKWQPGDRVTFTEDTTLYAIWEDAITISFNANGGTGTMADAYTLGEYFLPECGFTAPAGKYFVGWGDSADGEVKGQPGDRVTFTEDVTLYAVWKTDSIYVGGVELESGMYLPSGSTEPTATKPAGGYAYYESGVLTLNNYTYEGYGYDYDCGCAVYADNDVTVVLLGENSLKLTDVYSCGIYAEYDITLQGTGSLDIVADYGIYSYGGDITINSGTYNITAKQRFADGEAYYWCGIYTEYYYRRDIYINGGIINIESDVDGICSYDDLYISGGIINATGSEYGLWSDGKIDISGGIINATGSECGIYAEVYLEIYGVGTEVIASCDEDDGDDAIYSSAGFLYIDDDIEILIPEDGYAGDYCIYDADGEWVSSVHLKYDGYHIYVGGVGMMPGDYLDYDGNLSDTKPTEGGYAYYTYSDATGGVLTLHDYDYYGDGYIEDWDDYYGIATELGNLTIVLEGYNRIDTDWGAYFGIWVDGNLTITGSGVLVVNADNFGIGTYENLTIDGACVEVNASCYPLYYYVGDVTVKNGGLLYLYSDDGENLWVKSLTLDRGSLIIDNSYLFVQEYDSDWEEYTPGTITLNGTVLYAPYDGYIAEDYDYYDEPCTTVFDEDGDWAYYIEFYADGWINNWGEWYYYDAENDEWAEGLVRVPYPPTAIDGVTYAPDQDTLDYYEGKGETFIDAKEGWFYFDEDGVFISDYTRINFDSSMYFENGFAVWHPGFVEYDGDIYYFIGDTVYGGNMIATGDVYVSKNTTDYEFVMGGVYTFGDDGILCDYDGVTEMADGTLRYYEDAQLMMGAGLIELEDGYIYVRSNGELAVDCEYYVSNNNGLDIPVGMYTFDEEGFLVLPEGGIKEGVYFENGAWYYYENGKIVYNKGLISVGAIWHYPDGTTFGCSASIYVRSNGQLATGEYYVTNVGNYEFEVVAPGTKLIFSEEGKWCAPKNGILEVDGELYYFVNDQIQYNAGLIEYKGGWIYVRSSGKVATGKYWITNTNGNMDQGFYDFGEDGYMVISDVEDGIVNESGVLYYYEGGKKLYGVGLKQLSDGSYIYIRTNGELAVGSYWITNHNGLLVEGMYEFGADGILTVN